MKMNNCKNCGNAIFDSQWGEYKCYVKQRTCAPTEITDGCPEWGEKRAVKVESVKANGATFFPSVSKDGVLSWTNDQSLRNPDPVDIRGPRGVKGDDGETGRDGRDGRDGERGPQGIQGPQGIPGTPGRDGVDGKDGKDGAPGPQGVQGPQGPQGDPGQDGKDGVSPVISVEAVSGGHKVTVTDAEGSKEFTVSDGKDGEGGNGGGAAIIDVTELPTEGIREDCFYRLLTGSLVFNGFVQNAYTCYCVDGLPETGEPATNSNNTQGNVYFNIQDNELYGYVDNMLSVGLGVSTGWYPANVLLDALGYEYKGVITDITDDPSDSAFRFLLEKVIYQYTGVWTSIESIGRAGIGAGAEVFNHSSNVASGVASHAEGHDATASGVASHAEGVGITASGDYSHAEGYGTTASGDASHAEGYGTTASGDASHAEGWATTASGRSQHTQGEHNIIDPESDPNNPNKRGKYAHIVGNGTGNNYRSNAHTLDWEGLGWFAGGLKVGGTSQDDPAAKRVLVEGDVAGGVTSWNDLTDKPFGEEDAFEPIICPDMVDESVSYDISQFVGIDGCIMYRVDTECSDTDVYMGASAEFGASGNKITMSFAKIPSPFDFATVYQLGMEALGEMAIGFLVIVTTEHNYGIQTGVYVTDMDLGNGRLPLHGDTTNRLTISKKVLKTIDEKYLPESIGTGGEGGSGGGAAIIDVTELPTEGINEDCFYRLLTGSFVYNQFVHNNWTCITVNGLPEVGEPVTMDMRSVLAYYNTQDGEAYGYINSILSATAGVPVGWYPLTTLAGAFGLTYKGVITDINEDPLDNSYRLFLEYSLYTYKNEWIKQETIGRAGIGPAAEVFNHPSNVASGGAAHAEGYCTTAEGRSSHAEGEYTTASGLASHAEGDGTTASGHTAHTEGWSTVASGRESHAEGQNTTASGDRSHAEGAGTVACGRAQHVQGENNLLDPEYDPNDSYKKGKYAHIVGNGYNDSHRSNAHTLDWSGNAWFAGYVEGTALILPSPNSKRWRITVGDDGQLTAAEVTE